MQQIVWIVHRDPSLRVVLARLAAAGEGAVLASPSEDLLASGQPPDVVVLGLSGDFERELEFVHRALPRVVESNWVLVPEAGALDEARRLFDALNAEFIPFPPEPLALRRAVRAARSRRRVDSLSGRRRRDLLVARFRRWFADLELPDLLRALGPRERRCPLLIRGEPGTGRALLARYVHSFAERGRAADPGAFLDVDCRGVEQSAQLLAAIRDAAPQQPGRAWSLWLGDADQMPHRVQRSLQRWIELGLPDGACHCTSVRWLVGAGEGHADDPERELDVNLERAIAGLEVRIPPLRERPDAIEPLALDIALAWSRERGERPRRLSEDCLRALQEDAWPGNAAELEAVLRSALSSTSADPLLDSHLQLGAAAAGSLAAARPQAPAPEEVEPQRAGREAVKSPPQQRDGAANGPPTGGGAADPAQRSTPKAVDLATLLEDLLDAERSEIRARNLLVLRELDRGRPFGLGDEALLESAFRQLLATVLAGVPDRGDVYVASRHCPEGLAGEPAVRVLVRYRGSERSSQSAAEAADAGARAELATTRFAAVREILEAQAGRMTVDTTDARETVIVIDLPAPR